EPLSQYHKDIAASVQLLCEEVIFHILNYLYDKTGIKNICIAGGVAQNSVANGKVLQKTPFTKIYIPSAAYDAGTAIGSALWLYNQVLSNQREDFIQTAYYGASYTDEEIVSVLKNNNIEFHKYNNENEMVERTASLLTDGAVIGWFQGRTEFGDRKSTRLNSSHVKISYAVFCLKK